MRPVPQLDWIFRDGLTYPMNEARGYDCDPVTDFTIWYSSRTGGWMARCLHGSEGEQGPFPSRKEAQQWCQNHYRDALKAQEKWSAVPPVERGGYWIIVPGKKAVVFQITDEYIHPRVPWAEGTLFQRIPEAAEPYDFS